MAPETELLPILSTTGAARRFTDDTVSPSTLYRILDTARFAPSGGNRQPWRVVVVKDRARRERLRDLYLESFREYAAMVLAGLVPWAPVTDRRAEERAVADAASVDLDLMGDAGELARHLDQAPLLLVLLVDLRGLAAIDRDLARTGIAGGASVYPFAWSLLLAGRAEGLGGVLTTMVARREPEVRRLLGAPDETAVAGLVILGRPERQPTRLRRRPVEEFATFDTLDGPPLGSPGQ